MFKLLRALFFSLIISLPLRAQILPKERSMINYRLVGFSFPPMQDVSSYTIEIAQGNFITDSAFDKNIIKSVSASDNKILTEVPDWGKLYTWRTVYTGNNAAITKSALHHFSVLVTPNVDINITRLRIIKQAEKYKDSYIFSDGTRTLYDMGGHAIWTMPNISDLNYNGDPELSDLKLSSHGTITFLLGSQACEINYKADILWKAPDNGTISGDETEHYHHEFTRLSNGHYMVLGNEFGLWKRDSSIPENTYIKFLTGNKINRDSLAFYSSAGYIMMPFGTIIEYDEKGNVVWSWKSSKYLNASDVIYYRPQKTLAGIPSYVNAFYFDQKAKDIYISFRDISRIIKVKYPEGNVLDTYGEIYKPGAPVTGKNLFCEQHSCRISEKGNLYLFNNNNCFHTAGIPKIIMMQQPVSEKDTLKKIWEYDCAKADNFQAAISTGGNVIELPDESFLVCMGKPYGTSFIVGKDKKILWSGIPERFNMDTNIWERIPQNRSSIITTRKELEQLIWNAENQK